MRIKLLCAFMGLMILAGLASPTALAQGARLDSDPGPLGVTLAEDGLLAPPPVEVRYDPNPIPVQVAAPLPRQGGLGAQAATFVIDYVPAGYTNALDDICMVFPAAAVAPFEAAAAIWAGLIQSAVPLRIEACWASLPAGVLGHSAATTYVRDWTTGSAPPLAGTFYQVALANALAGVDLYPVPASKPAGCNPATCPNSNWDDLSIAFANGYSSSFYYGTSGNPGPLTDLESVMVHEIAHALGFAGSMYLATTTTVGWGAGGFPAAYDRFTVDGAGVSLINTATYPNPSAALLTALTSGSISFSGPIAKAANAGANVPLYAPNPYRPGSSYAHLAESYNGGENALMTYSIGPGEVLHAPGPVGMGVLNDVGWKYLAIPTGLVLSLPTATSVRLDWNDPASGETGFKVERSLADTAHWTTLATTAANTITYTDSPLVEGTTVYYRVSTVFAGPYTTSATTPAMILMPLAAPSGLSAAAAAPGQIDLTWADNSLAETGYLVERSSTGGAPWSNLTPALLAAGSSSFADTTLAEKMAYTYQVTAVNAATGAQSVPTVSAAITTLLNTPTSFFASPVLGGGKIQIRWADNSSFETGYWLQKAASAGGPWTDVTPVLPAGTTAYLWTTAEGTYFFQVRANGTPNSAFAGPISATLGNRWLFIPVVKQ
jgi:hypothetical protein